MKIIYAVVAACLSLQACNNQAPTVSAPVITQFDDYAYNADADFYVDEYNVGVVTTGTVPTGYLFDAGADFNFDGVNTAAVKPINGAEFAGTSRDDANTAWSTIYFHDDEYTATVNVPPTETGASETYLGFHIDEDGGLVYDLTETPSQVETPPWP
jgi:hypothetical protein